MLLKESLRRSGCLDKERGMYRVSDPPQGRRVIFEFALQRRV
jgi:hypothetical protein